MSDRTRAVLVRAIALALGLAVVELGVRLVSAVVSGPRALLYGTPWVRRPMQPSANAAWHTNEAAGYTKYFPHEEKWLIDLRGRHRVGINNHGFRGPDYTIAKAPGVVRVLTLGASSTFGFENRDDETYPHYLQRALDRTEGVGRFEVINFAIPHAGSDQIVAMFLAEGEALAPDVVTIYEGLNDAKDTVMRGLYRSALTAAGERLLAAELVRQLASVALPAPRIIASERIVGEASARYLRSLDVLAEACRRIGATLIVVTQQSRSTMVSDAEIRGMPHATEARLVTEWLAGDPATLTRFNILQLHHGAIFVAHARATDDVRRWTATHDVMLVEGIHALDRERDLLVSWVHLAPAANEMLAKALAPAVVAAVRSRVR